jgi:predicted Rossmann fold flavoprotein
MTGEILDPVVIVGAGAAGLMAATFATAGPRPVLLIEGSDRPGQKILISGGGRCNILPTQASPEDYVTDSSPHSLRKIFLSWPLTEVRRFFEHDLGLPLRLEPETGKLFPASDRARSVRDALLNAFLARGGQMRTHARVAALSREGDRWLVRLAEGEPIAAASVVLATGGLSIPTTGSNGTGLQIAQSLGHSLHPTYPALVPLTTENQAHRALAGISLSVTLSAPLPGSQRLAHSAGGFLFTHRGYSGPTLLNLSHLAVRAGLLRSDRPPIWVQWTPLDATAWDALLRSARGPALSLLRQHLPERLAAQLLADASLTGVDLSQLRRDDRQHLVETLTRYPLPWSGHEGYRVAEVTGGGIPLSEVNPVTLESRLTPGLYLCGEMLDAFGPIGGYNFLWAWITGRSAGLACNHAV